MAMKLEASKELVSMIERSAREWKKIKSQLEEKYHHYDVFAKEFLGIEVDFSTFENAVVIHGAQIVDDDKYINFVLKYGDMPNE